MPICVVTDSEPAGWKVARSLVHFWSFREGR
jgi:hypothetical protein